MANQPTAPTRRDLIALSAAAAAALATQRIPLARAADAPASTQPVPSFPPDFQWGTATAAFQIEGASREDGKGPSIWDAFAEIPGKIANGDKPDISCDFYHRYESDIKLMVDLGVKHFRFSISWPRILPAGTGAVNEKGLDFYSRLTDRLLASGITPHATLFHWDLPDALQKSYGGWQNRQVAQDFAGYVSIVAKRLGDRIVNWMTMNEIASFTTGYAVGKAPGSAPGVALNTQKEKNQVIHHAQLAHGLACLALRANCTTSPIVALAENYAPFVPVIETPEHIEAVRRAFLRENGILIPILTGTFDPGWLEDNKDALPDMKADDLKTIHQPLDALGCNCYTGRYVRHADNAKGYEIIPWFPAYPAGAVHWLHIVPESIYWAIRLISDTVGLTSLPIFISENGYADGATPDANGFVLDTDRICYLRANLNQLTRVLREGFPLKGYFIWSLLDNMEWSEGYTKRFGLIRVDYPTLKRIPKLSFDWYREVIRSGRAL
jgi:beta-glucosidase